MPLPRLLAFRVHRNRHVWEDAPDWALELCARLDMVAGALQLDLQMEKEIMVDLTKVQSDVAAQDSILQSVVVYVQGLQAAAVTQTQQMAALQAALDAAKVEDPAVQKAADDLAAHIEANNTLAQNIMPAIVENTNIPPAQANAAVDATTTDPSASATASPSTDAPAGTDASGSGAAPATGT